jgi:nitroreductase
MHVDEAIVTRRSVRGFTDQPVPRSTIEHLLRVARRAPSGTNMQPWHVSVVTGETKQAITQDALTLHNGPAELLDPEYKYYPDIFYEPYKSRRRKIGLDTYGLVGIEKGQTEKMHAQAAQNLHFFGAPVGLFFFVDRALELGSWIDYGMFIQNVMLSARGQGLHTCPQAAWPPYHQAVRKHLQVEDEQS